MHGASGNPPSEKLHLAQLGRRSVYRQIDHQVWKKRETSNFQDLHAEEERKPLLDSPKRGDENELPLRYRHFAQDAGKNGRRRESVRQPKLPRLKEGIEGFCRGGLTPGEETRQLSRVLCRKQIDFR